MYKSHVVHFQARANVTATCVTADTLVMITTSVRHAQPTVSSVTAMDLASAIPTSVQLNMPMQPVQ